PVVRRSSGGGAIVHHHEWTYCLVLPTQSQGRLRREPTLGYRWVHGAIVTAFAKLGVDVRAFRESSRVSNESAEPFLCFRRRTDEDLILAGYKVVGSAQRRGRHAWMQHGSVLWTASPFAPELPGVADLASVRLGAADFCDAFRKSLGDAMSWSWQPGDLSPQESDLAERWTTRRYAAATWTTRR
ncbi:MAG: lipoate--protein ligase family protein, partial [Planctomycetota bacterium]